VGSISKKTPTARTASLRFGDKDRYKVADIKLNHWVSLRRTIAELSSSYWSPKLDVIYER